MLQCGVVMGAMFPNASARVRGYAPSSDLPLLAAALFGASTPLSKALLGEVDPIVLAGLLYAGSGAGLAIVQLLRIAFIQRAEAIAWPSRRESDVVNHKVESSRSTH